MGELETLLGFEAGNSCFAHAMKGEGLPAPSRTAKGAAFASAGAAPETLDPRTATTGSQSKEKVYCFFTDHVCGGSAFMF